MANKPKILVRLADGNPRGIKGAKTPKEGDSVELILDYNGQKQVLTEATIHLDGSTQPPVDLPPIVSAGDDLIVDSGQTGIVLDGSASDPDGRISRAEWKQTQGPTVQLVKDPNDVTIVKFDAPTLQAGQESIALLFEFEAEDDKGDVVKDACIVTVGKEIRPPPPPPIGNYPLNQQIKWLWSSDEVLSHDGVFPTKKRSPFDPVLLYSNASSVQSHTVKEKKLIINKGAAFGRVYLEYYELDDYKAQDSKLGYTTILTGTFVPTKVGGAANFSVKDGNHGTTGYDLDGQTFFGGFGWSAHETELQSKDEGKHGVYNGQEESASYPAGIKLKEFTAYKFFAVWEADQKANSCILNVWIDFNDGNKWTRVFKDRKWENSSDDWKKTVASLPANGQDTEEAKKGPAFVRRHHVWLRANDADVEVYDLRIGTTL